MWWKYYEAIPPRLFSGSFRVICGFSLHYFIGREQDEIPGYGENLKRSIIPVRFFNTAFPESLVLLPKLVCPCNALGDLLL